MNQVHLEIVIPADGDKGPPKPEDIKPGRFYIPRVRRLVLTKESELALFGNLWEYRMSVLPPLLDIDENRVAIGEINQEQVDIYNNRLRAKFKDEPPVEKWFIKPGTVKVTQTCWDIHLENVNENAKENQRSVGEAS